MRLPFLSTPAAILALAFSFVFSGFPFPASAQATTSQISVDEYSLKAAFLYNLAKFMDWPPNKFENDDSPIIIGVEGPEALEKFTVVVNGKIIARRKVVVRPIRSDAEIKDCQILFITRSQDDPTMELRNLAEKLAILTVGESDKFLDSGGMIRFYLEADNLRLEINNDSIHHAGLSIKANALSTLVNKGIAKLKKLQP